MTESSRFWDGNSIGDASGSPWDAANEFAQVMLALCGGYAVSNDRGGVVRGYADECQVTGATSISMVFHPGQAVVHGTWYLNDAAPTLTLAANPAVANRYDRVVLRKDWAAQTVRYVVITGVEGGGIPNKVQVEGATWDVPIATLLITPAGAVTITDDRAFIPYVTPAMSTISLSMLATGFFTLTAEARGKFANGFVNNDLILDDTIATAKMAATPYCRLRNVSSPQSLGSTPDVWTTLEWDQVDAATPATMFAYATSKYNIVIPVDGIYQVNAIVRFDIATGTGKYRAVSITKNPFSATNSIAYVYVPSNNPGGVTVVNCSGLLQCTAGDTIAVGVAHGDSVAVSTAPSSTYNCLQFQCAYVGSV